MAQGRNRIGSVYKKAVFREYTDSTFSRRKRRGRDSRDEHYGLSGPPIRAQVGEHVVVVIFNKASRPYSFLPNGVSLTKENEGAVYKNSYYGTSFVFSSGLFYHCKDKSTGHLRDTRMTIIFHRNSRVFHEPNLGLYLLTCSFSKHRFSY